MDEFDERGIWARAAEVHFRHSRWLDDSAEFYGVVAQLALLLGVVGFALPTGWQVLDWLRTGEWHALPAASVGLVRILELEGEQADGTLLAWASNPQSWVGLHKLVDWLSVGGALFIVGLVVASIAIVVALAAEASGEAACSRGANALRRAEQNGEASPADGQSQGNV